MDGAVLAGPGIVESLSIFQAGKPLSMLNPGQVVTQLTETDGRRCCDCDFSSKE
jgi:hypothetical protein